MQIRKIEPPAPPLPQRKKTAGYARVSDGKEAMLHSLSAQVSYYSEYIGRNPDWEYRGVFSDEALSGTREDRPGFQALLVECRAGKIDLVITKSISRLARNTVTILKSIRELKALGVDIFFEAEKIHSLSAEGELMLTILSSYAQEQSRQVSENCKWRIRNDFKEGKPNIGKLLGYRLKDGVFTIVPEEAEIVRQIFADYLSGMGTLAIQKKLLSQGVKLSQGGVMLMLRQEKYAGDLLLQKTYIENHISKRGRKNDGQLPQYHVRDAHEAIISREDFEAVQAEIARRAAIYTPKKAPVNNSAFTGLIRCGKCGRRYKRKITNAGGKYEKITWICPTFNGLGKAECDSQMIPEDILFAKAQEVGGLEAVAEILVPEKNRLVFIMKSGARREAVWQHTSRRESWTPEMREAVRQRNYDRKRKEQSDA